MESNEDISLESFSKLTKRSFTQTQQPPGSPTNDNTLDPIQRTPNAPSSELLKKRMNMPTDTLEDRNKRRKIMQSDTGPSPPDPELTELERIYQYNHGYRMPIPQEFRYYLTHAALIKLCLWHTKKLRCLRCSQFYFESENIGQWKCKQHVRVFNRDVAGQHHPVGVWECCGRSPIWRHDEDWPNHANGCVECDHKSDHAGAYLHPRDDVTIHPVLIEYLNIPGRAISKIPNGDNVSVMRLNEARASQLRHRKHTLRTDAVEMFNCIVNKRSVC